MVDQHLLHTAPLGLIKQQMQLAGGKVAAGEDDVGFRDNVQAGLRRIGDRAVGIERGEREGSSIFRFVFGKVFPCPVN